MMTGRPIIRVGDKTTHGGTVIEGFSSYSIDGRAAAGLGHNVECPTCNGIYPIVEGVSSFTIDGGYVAIEGMRTACGATLIASQNIASVIPDSGGIARVSRNWRTREKELRKGGAGSERPHSDVLRQSSCEHADTAVIPAEYIVREMKTNPFSIRGRQIHDSNHFDFGSYSRQWSESPWYAKLSSRPTYVEALAEEKLRAYALWADIVEPGQPWDHKPMLQKMLKGVWNSGWQKSGAYDYFYDIWSNIHYGYVGVAVGFTPDELINGAGIAQALHDTLGALAEPRLPSMQNHPENGGWPASAGDRPDHISIRLGCDLYVDVKPHALTPAILLGAVQAVPVPWGSGQDRSKEIHDCER
ncbi:PAAR domain-containing protein [Achromobacter mucicolens]|uniref:PAAR domain-containing protein n=1 Tax=Achromobacter mucicolens TaxID=1389922 RepID=UPI00320AE80C